VSEGLVQGPYMVAGVRFEPATFKAPSHHTPQHDITGSEILIKPCTFVDMISPLTTICICFPIDFSTLKFTFISDLHFLSMIGGNLIYLNYFF